jgi:hypothetical protein
MFRPRQRRRRFVLGADGGRSLVARGCGPLVAAGELSARLGGEGKEASASGGGRSGRVTGP